MSVVFKKLDSYTFLSKIYIITCIIWTRLFYTKCRLVRLPLFIRGKKYINFGEGLTTGVATRIEVFPKRKDKKYYINIGNNVQINDYVHITAITSVNIGDNVLIASKVFISDHNHGSYSGEEHSSPDIVPTERPLYSAPVNIEKNVWIGEFVSILPGITIGQGSIIGANSVVSKNIPPYSIAAGVPAKVLKQYNFITYKWEKI